MDEDKNKNCLLILDDPTPAKIRERIYMPSGKLRNTTGFVYILECGEYVKIGKTAKPDRRYSQIRQGAYSYGGVETGRMAISARMKDYGNKETELHSKFSSLRKNGTELFSIPFEIAVTELIRVGEENETIMDEATAYFHFENRIMMKPKLLEISKNAIASQILSALFCRVLKGGYNYTSIYALKYITGLSQSEVQEGLSTLETVGAIYCVPCEDMLLIKFIL